jgi:hypothetical protein
MQLTCPHCQASWEFSDRRPAFCPFCGKPLPAETPTQTFPPPGVADSEAVTQAAPLPAGGDASDPKAIGGYRLLRVLGVGGMGKVYEAEDVHTGRRVALKLVSADYAGSASAVERFRQEGRLASLIAHPRCVFVLAADEEAGRPYIVMELMQGDTLDEYVKRNGPQAPGRAVAMILDVMEGLQEAHRVGVVHRDVKPSNCFFGADRRLKVGDFGLSKSLAQGAHLTKTGSFLGTPLYASPEQVRGDAIDAQTDVYSVAATLYYLLTGRAPFQSENAAVTLARIAADPAPSMRTLRPELPPALDAVVLRGLERDRKQRWQSIEEFAEALSPFLQGRISLGNLGVRLAAFVIDYGVFMAFGSLTGLVLLSGASGDLAELQWSGLRTLPQLAGIAFWLLYFGLGEWLFGCTVGKWLLRLRVRRADTGGAPGWRRVLLRTALFYLLLESGALVAVWVVYPLAVPPDTHPNEAFIFTNWFLLFASLPWLGIAVGSAALMCTMRARNGYRGLHEIASGTYVVPVPRPARSVALAATTASQVVKRSNDLPAKIGPYDVRGAFRWDDDAKVLLGFDAALGRQALLWLGPAGEPALPAERTELNRTTRLRWLAAGRFDAFRWDAFLMPGGCSLPALVAATGALSWPRFQPLLQELTEELLQAVVENTLPAPLVPEMVWVAAEGRLVLLDVPLTPPQNPATPGDHGREFEAVRLLGRVAVQALEGRAVSPNEVLDRLRVPLPLSAAAVLRDLLAYPLKGLSLRVVRDRLAALRAKPAEVTRPRRVGQLALLTLLLFLALGFCMTPMTAAFRFGCYLADSLMAIDSAEQGLEALDKADLSDELCGELNPQPPPRLWAVAQLQLDAPLRAEFQGIIKQKQERTAAQVTRGGLIYQLSYEQNHDMFAEHRAQRQQRAAMSARPTSPTELRKTARWQKQFSPDRFSTLDPILCGIDVIANFSGPLLWVLWAFVARGGLSYLMTGIAIVRHDGLPAGRFRCLWRALLVWPLPAALFFVSYRLDAWYWAHWDPAGSLDWLAWLAACVFWGTYLLLAAYFVTAVCFPKRSLHDVLAGTYLVPR